MTPSRQGSTGPQQSPPTAPAPGEVEVVGAVGAALRSAVDFCSDRIGARTEEGVVTLTGQVPWAYQREAAERCVVRVPGVRGVRNDLEVASSALPADLVRAVVEGVLVRHAVARARACEVTTGTDGRITVAGGTTEAEAEEIDLLLRSWSARANRPGP